MHHDLSPELKACVDRCRECHDVCLHSAAGHCLESGGKHVRPAHFRLLLDCAQICTVTADFLLRRSDYHSAVCGACAEICDACAEDCERMGSMVECVELCRKCAAACRHVAAVVR